MTQPLPPPWNRFVPVLQRLFVWAVLFGILWILRPFFILVFLTFVFGYVLNHGVDALEPFVKKRPTRVVVVFLILLSVFVGVGFSVAPSVRKQATSLPQIIAVNAKKLDTELRGLRDRSELARNLLPEDISVARVAAEITGIGTAPAKAQKNGDDAQDPDTVRQIVPFFVGLASGSLAVGGWFLLSLLFSFLIILDLPKLRQGLRSLRDSRMRFVYDEVSDSIYHFGRILGRALEAQSMIAIVNTSLTAIGLSLMQLPYVPLLSTVVFVCSFIPVAGVFVSSIPICLTALQESGLSLLLVSIAFITLIHVIEAYILNPRIYGAHLRMNPVLVLAILVISHHLFGVWGLVLGVPVANYVVQYVIHSGQVPREEYAS